MAARDRIVALYWNKFTSRLCEHTELQFDHMSELELKNFNARLGKGDPILVYIPGKRTVHRLTAELKRKKRGKHARHH